MIILLTLLLGLCFGSFSNAVTWRILKQQTSKSKKYSISKGRSMCPQCGHELGAQDLVPVVSWVLLRGKCRYCHRAISWHYPATEILTSLSFAFSFIFWPYDFSVVGVVMFIIWLAILVILVILFQYDLRWMELPNRLILPLILVSVLLVFVRVFNESDNQQLLGSLIGLFIIGGFFYVLFQLSDGKWIGGGDVKLGFALGLIVTGPANSLLLLFIASLLGSLVSIPLLLKGASSKTKVPFGPFLILAAYIVFLFGASITNWYQTQILLASAGLLS